MTNFKAGSEFPISPSKTPGFLNHKYDPPHPVTVEKLSDEIYRPDRIPASPPDSSPRSPESANSPTVIAPSRRRIGPPPCAPPANVVTAAVRGTARGAVPTSAGPAVHRREAHLGVVSIGKWHGTGSVEQEPLRSTVMRRARAGVRIDGEPVSGLIGKGLEDSRADSAERTPPEVRAGDPVNRRSESPSRIPARSV